MTVFERPTRKTSAVACVAMVFGLVAAASGQTATRPAAGGSPADAERAAKPEGPQIGKIKGDNVYVRSGSHLNYYPVTKLNRGEQITVVGEQYGWLEILPPAGTFSLIDKTFVDRAGDNGTLNGDRWVNAGSNTVEDSRYAKQVKLKRGDTVHIVGETKDGAFFKIEPPPGAHVWVKSEFVEGVSIKGTSPAPKAPDRVATGDLHLEGDTPAVTTRPARGMASATTRPSTGGIVMRNTPGARTAAKRATTTDEPRTITTKDTYQPQMSAIEAELEAENIKPLGQRSYDQLLSKLRPMAEQKEDEVASLYAQARIKQIEGSVDAHSAAKEIAALTQAAIRDANGMAATRPAIPPLIINPLDAIVVRGELRVSNVYEGSAGRPKRWRVVEANGDTAARTLAYIELPPDSSVNPTDFYGKYIGIRASARQVSSDTIPPIPIYTVAEIVVLDTSSKPARGGSFAGATAIASPPSRPIATPSSQPSKAVDE